MAKKYWTYLETSKYNIGLTSRTVYIYDKNNNELATFKDLTYAYKGIISPNEEMLIIKSSEGRIAVYSLIEFKLIKKFRFSKVDGSQDDNFIFSPDSKYLFNIERHSKSTKTALSIYNTMDFSLDRRLLEDDDLIGLCHIEYDQKADDYFILGLIRDSETRCASKFFISKFINDKLEDIRYIDQKQHGFILMAKNVETSGFTEESYKWNFIFKTKSLNELKTMDLSLSSLWEQAKS